MGQKDDVMTMLANGAPLTFGACLLWARLVLRGRVEVGVKVVFNEWGSSTDPHSQSGVGSGASF